MQKKDEAIQFIGEFNFALLKKEIEEGQLRQDVIQQIGIAMDKRVNGVFISKFQDRQEELPTVWLKMLDKWMEILDKKY